jgi:hypothetical protein
LKGFFEPTVLYRKSTGEKFAVSWLQRVFLRLRWRDLVDVRSFFDSSFKFDLSALDLSEGAIEWDKALACLAWVSKNVKFVPDDREYWQMPGETASLLAGDCEDGAILLANMLSSMSLENVKIVCGALSAGVGHCIVEYNGIQLDWLHLAPIQKVWFRFSKDEVEICKT